MAVLATRGLGQGQLVSSRGLGRSVIDLGGFGSGVPIWKFRRLDEEPRKLKVKSRITDREIEFEAPRRELLESADQVQRQIDIVRAAQLEAQALFQELLRLARFEADGLLLAELMERLAQMEIELFEAEIAFEIAEELKNVRLFLTMVDDLISKLILVKRKRADEEVLVMILGSNILH